MAKRCRVYELHFTRYTLEILTFVNASMSELAVCKLNGEQHILWVNYWYQLTGDRTRQLRVNVIGYTLLAQHLHMLQVSK